MYFLKVLKWKKLLAHVQYPQTNIGLPGSCNLGHVMGHPGA